MPLCGVCGVSGCLIEPRPSLSSLSSRARVQDEFLEQYGTNDKWDRAEDERRIDDEDGEVPGGGEKGGWGLRAKERKKEKEKRRRSGQLLVFVTVRTPFCMRFYAPHRKRRAEKWQRAAGACLRT